MIGKTVVTKIIIGALSTVVLAGGSVAAYNIIQGQIVETAAEKENLRILDEQYQEQQNITSDDAADRLEDEKETELVNAQIAEEEKKEAESIAAMEKEEAEREAKAQRDQQLNELIEQRRQEGTLETRQPIEEINAPEETPVQEEFPFSEEEIAETNKKFMERKDITEEEKKRIASGELFRRIVGTD